MKRIYRNDMPQQQKDKIAAANKGKTLTQQTRAKISKSLQQYWQRLPMKPSDNGGTSGSTGGTGGTIQPFKYDE